MEIQEIINEIKKLSINERIEFDSLRLKDEEYKFQDKIIVLDNCGLLDVMHNDRFREIIQRDKYGIPYNENNSLHGADSIKNSLKSKSKKKTKKGKYSISLSTPMAEMGRILTFPNLEDNPDCKDTIASLFHGAYDIFTIYVFKDEKFIEMFNDQIEIKKKIIENLPKNKKKPRDSFFLTFKLIKKYNIKYKILDQHKDVVFNFKNK